MKNFTFFSELLDLNSREIEVIGGYFLKNANPEVVNQIKHGVRFFDGLHRSLNPWEYSCEEVTKPGIRGAKFIKHDKRNEPKFLILEYSQDEMPPELEIALRLSPLDLHSVYSYSGIAEEGVVEVLTGYFARYADLEARLLLEEKQGSSDFYVPKYIEDVQIKTTRRIYQDLSRFDFEEGRFTFISESIKDFFELQTLLKKSKLKHLGLFIILEKLLTHNSKGTDQSITRQITRKVILANNRAEKPLDIVSSFRSTDTTTESKVLELLYGYRSKLAHGENPDFKDKLQILTSSDTVYNFMYQLVKAMLLQAIKEPQLILDLKYC